MRIVMVTPDIEIDRRIIQEAQTLIRKRGDEIILITAGSENFPQFEISDGIKIERLDFTIRRKNQVVGFFPKIVAKLLGIGTWVLHHISRLKPYEQRIFNRICFYEPDVICSHDFPYLKAALHAAKRLNVPLVYDAHELYSDIFTLTLKEKFIIRLQEKQYIRKCDQVITVNHFLAKILAERYHIPIPEVILNAVSSPKEFNSNCRYNCFRDVFSIPEDHKIILFQGWFSSNRGLHELVESFALLDQSYHLILMGYGDYAKALLNLSQELHISHRIHFKGAVSQKELLFWTASADAGIIPYQPVDLNHYYCSPNKLYEFIQAGLPIIANDLPYLNEVITKENIGVTAPFISKEDIASTISNFFESNQHNFQRYKKNLLKKSHDYTWESQEPALLKIYDRFRQETRTTRL